MIPCFLLITSKDTASGYIEKFLVLLLWEYVYSAYKIQKYSQYILYISPTPPRIKYVFRKLWQEGPDQTGSRAGSWFGGSDDSSY